MGFPKEVRIEALVRSQRRCCVCHRYKGVGVEVHHIIQEANGGPNTLENAIVLCFDCHAAAGHYNPKHPKGTKYSPEELIRHRDEWWERVGKSGISDLREDSLPDYYVRHLISLDENATKEIFDYNKKDLPFDYDFLVNNEAGKFMRGVLSDKLPHTWASSKSMEGFYWSEDTDFKTEEEFFKAHPEFKGRSHRPLVPDDFNSGGIESKLLHLCFKEGMPPEKIGQVRVEMDMCGGPTVFSYYSVRRPIFLFALIENKSKQHFVLTKLLSRHRKTKSVKPKPFNRVKNQLKKIDTAPIRLESGQSVLIPEMVLLSSPNQDDCSYFFSEYRNISSEQGQEIGFGSKRNIDELDYWVVGPIHEINGFEAEVEGQVLAFSVHRFRPELSYSIARFWRCGSCPHVFFKNFAGKWMYSHEILSKGFRKKDRATIHVPSRVIKLMIHEIEYEVTTVSSVKINGREYLDKAKQLSKGESLIVDVKAGDIVVVEGHYTANISEPQNHIHLRQKATLLKAAELYLNR